jgi:hypothetical protein
MILQLHLRVLRSSSAWLTMTMIPDGNLNVGSVSLITLPSPCGTVTNIASNGCITFTPCNTLGIDSFKICGLLTLRQWRWADRFAIQPVSMYILHR